MRWLPRPPSAAALVVALTVGACGQEGRAPTAGEKLPATIRLESPAFPDGGEIPVRFTCDGDDVSPPLVWSGVPAGAEAIALAMTDSDAPRGPFVHWLVARIPPTTAGLGVGQLPDEAVEGNNSADTTGYTGPCPPRADPPHHYVFTLYALGSPLGLEYGFSARRFNEALEGRVLARGQLIGSYTRDGGEDRVRGDRETLARRADGRILRFGEGPVRIRRS